MKTLNLISFIILLIGGLNWLSVGIFQFDIVAGIFGSTASVFSRIIYILVGIAALYLIYASIVEKGKVEMIEKYDNVKSVKNVSNN